MTLLARGTAAAWILLSSLTWGCADDSSSDGLDPDFETFIETTMQAEEIPGMAVAIVHGDETVWSKGFGYADLEVQRRATADTPFTIGSISKTFIAVAMMQAMEAGTITLDTPVNDTGISFEVDNPRVDDDTITLLHLATHTSGIVDADIYDECSYYIESSHEPLMSLVNPATTCADPMPTELGDFLDAYLSPGGAYYDPEDNFADSKPGETRAYSNVAASLAALAVSAAADTPFEDLCEEGIFAPLEMANTHWRRSQFDDGNPVATQYILLDDERTAIPDYSLATWPDGGLRTSANDLARFVGAIMNAGEWAGARILEQDSVQAMLSSRTDSDGYEGGLEAQGIFWVQELGVVGHSGGDPGVSAAMYFLPAADLAIVLLANLEVSDSTFASLVNETFKFAVTFAQ